MFYIFTFDFVILYVHLDSQGVSMANTSALLGAAAAPSTILHSNTMTSDPNQLTGMQ